MTYQSLLLSFSILIIIFFSKFSIAEEWSTLGSGAEVKRCAAYNKECIKKIKIKYGEVSIQTKDAFGFYLLFNKNQISTLGGSSLSIQEKITIGQDEIILLALNSGGRSCPMKMYIVQVSNTSSAISEPFGSCSDYYKTYIENNVFVVRTPFYFNPMHLRDLSKKEREEVENTGDTEFRWSNSKITEINDVKKR